MKNYILIIPFAFIILSMISGCTISLSGISIDPNIQSFNVERFENIAELEEPTLAVDLTEQLKDRIRNSSRLEYNNKKPDIIFIGTITQYRITSEAPQRGDVTAFNQLSISLRVEYEEVGTDKKNWKKTFTRFANFPAEQDFNSVKDALIEEISEYLIQDVFNESFAKNW